MKIQFENCFLTGNSKKNLQADNKRFKIKNHGSSIEIEFVPTLNIFFKRSYELIKKIRNVILCRHDNIFVICRTLLNILYRFIKDGKYKCFLKNENKI